MADEALFQTPPTQQSPLLLYPRVHVAIGGSPTPTPTPARLGASARSPCHPGPSPHPSRSLREPSPPPPPIPNFPSRRTHFFNVRVTYMPPANGHAARGGRGKPPPTNTHTPTRTRGSSAPCPQASIPSAKPLIIEAAPWAPQPHHPPSLAGAFYFKVRQFALCLLMDGERIRAPLLPRRL